VLSITVDGKQHHEHTGEKRFHSTKMRQRNGKKKMPGKESGEWDVFAGEDTGLFIRLVRV